VKTIIQVVLLIHNVTVILQALVTVTVNVNILILKYVTMMVSGELLLHRNMNIIVEVTVHIISVTAMATVIII